MRRDFFFKKTDGHRIGQQRRNPSARGAHAGHPKRKNSKPERRCDVWRKCRAGDIRSASSWRFNLTDEFVVKFFGTVLIQLFCNFKEI